MLLRASFTTRGAGVHTYTDLGAGHTRKSNADFSTITPDYAAWAVKVETRAVHSLNVKVPFYLPGSVKSKRF